MPVSTLLPLPGSVSPIQGSLLEPLANLIHAISLTSQRFPETVVIIGAGTIGLFAPQVGKISGALRLVAVDTADPRLDVALQLGAETVGAGETRHQAVKMARRGGEVLARPAR